MISEKIYSYSKILATYLKDLEKLRNLKRIKNYDLIIEEIVKLTDYTDNSIFFLSLENVVRNDINDFVEEINQFIMENLNLDYELDYLLNMIDKITQLNKNFQKKERKIH